MRLDLYKSFEQLFNNLLVNNPDSLRGILEYSGSIICIELLNTRTTLYISINENGISVTDSCETKPDVTIKATPLELINYFLLIKRNESVSSGNLEISGNINLPQRLQTIFTTIDTDWEENLSQYFGDELSHTAGRFGEKLSENIRYAVSEFLVNASEYIRYEKDVVVGREEIETLNNSIDQLRDDVERLNVRLKRIHMAGVD